VSVDADTVRAMEREGWNAAGAEGLKFLREAVERGDADAVAALLAAGADPNGGMPPVLGVARRASIVRQLVAAGAMVDLPDTIGRTPLQIAARWFEPDVVAALLEAKANPNLAGPVGETALMAAARGGRAETVRLLLAAGAAIGARNESGQDALAVALQAKAEPAVRPTFGPPPPRQFDEIIDLLRGATRRDRTENRAI